MKIPTATMALGMELACHMLQKKPKPEHKNKFDTDPNGYFECAKTTLLNNPNGFMDAMKEYDKENIPPAVVKRVNAILQSEDFTYEKVKNAAGALVAILKWSQAMMNYNELLKVVNPKREKVKEMNEKLAIVNAELSEKRRQVREVEETIASLEAMFQEKLDLEQRL